LAEGFHELIINTSDEFGMYISTYISRHVQFTWILILQKSVCQLPVYEVNKSGNITTNWHKKLQIHWMAWDV